MNIKRSKISTGTTVAPKRIGIRELVRNMTKVKAAVAHGEVFEVLDRATPVFTITPTMTKTYKYTTEDLKNLRFTAKDKNLSLNIDTYLYGKK